MPCPCRVRGVFQERPPTPHAEFTAFVRGCTAEFAWCSHGVRMVFARCLQLPHLARTPPVNLRCAAAQTSEEKQAC